MKIKFFDGGMGSLLQAKGLKRGEAPDLWNLTQPEKVLAVHRAYAEAGSEYITTNTFGANRLRFPNTEAIVKAGVELAKSNVLLLVNYRFFDLRFIIFCLFFLCHIVLFRLSFIVTRAKSSPSIIEGELFFLIGHAKMLPTHINYNSMTKSVLLGNFPFNFSAILTSLKIPKIDEPEPDIEA